LGLEKKSGLEACRERTEGPTEAQIPKRVIVNIHNTIICEADAEKKGRARGEEDNVEEDSRTLWKEDPEKAL